MLQSNNTNILTHSVTDIVRAYPNSLPFGSRMRVIKRTHRPRTVAYTVTVELCFSALYYTTIFHLISRIHPIGRPFVVFK